MKKLFTFIVGAVVGLGAYAQDFDSGGLYYSVLSTDDKTCAVTGCRELGSVLEIPDIVQFEGEEYTVTEIGPWAFQGLSFTSLSLPSTLVTIRDGGFYNSYQLMELVIPNSVKEIGSNSFTYSGALQRVVLGSSVEVINYNAFGYCDQLSVVVPEGDTPARFNDGYSNSFTSNPLVAVSENLIDVYKAAWEGANVVANVPAESISFDPESYTVTPGGSVQLNCVVVPSNAPVKFSTWNRDVITVDNNGLVTADNLRGGFNVGVTATSLNGITAECSIMIESVEEFESDGLVFVVLNGTENEVALIRYESNSTVVNIPGTVEYNGNIYSVTTIGNNVFRYNDSVEEVVIPASVNLIREDNFNYCGQLKKVHIADSATPLNLSNNNFTDDDSLAEIYVGRDLIYSEETTCFRWIYSLSRVVLGPEVNSLPANIFGDCYNLNFIESQNTVPPVLGENAFGYNNLTIIVPAESVEAYRSAWEQYGSYIIDTVDATELSFETEEVTIYNGQNIKLPLVVEPEGATVIWSSSNPNIAYVDKEGNVSYNRGTTEVGEAVITASSINGLTAECKVIAKHWLTFTEDNVSMTPGSTYEVKVTKPEELANAPITWVSSNESVATVDESGLITAEGPGDAEIIANVEVPVDEYMVDSFSYSIQVEVRTEVTSVTPVDPVISVWVEESTPINLLFEPDDEYVNREMTWEVADPEIAEVFSYENGNGYSVRGLKPGNTTITGTTANGIEVTIEVVVKTRVEEVIFPKEVLYISPDESVKLEFTTVPSETNVTFSYSSDNEEVATVDEDGVITAHNLGGTYIAVWAENPWGGLDWKASQRVEVVNMPESVTWVGSSDYEGTVNEWTQLQIEYTPNNDDVCRDIQWTIDNPEIGDFGFWDNIYHFYGRKIGTTAFRGVAVNGDVLEGTITVNGIMIVVDGEETDMKEVNLGDEFRIGVEASSENLLDNINYVSENPEVVTVTEDGMVTAVGYGRGTIRVSTSVEVGENEVKYYSDYIDITVRPLEGIALSANKITLSPNDWRYISVIRAENVEWSEVTWTSSDENVVTINTWGGGEEAQLSYVGPGTATVTATDSYGNVASCEVVCVANIEDFTFNTKKVYVAPGGTFQLEYTTVPEETGQTIRFESGNVDIATVDPETGLVTGVDYGSTEIYAIPSNGWNSWSVPVLVCNLPESVTFAGSPDYEGAVNQWTQFQIEYTPNDEDICREIQWTVDNPELVYIDSNNNAFYGYKIGTTAFRGVAANGDVLEGTITINGIMIVVDGEETDRKEVNLGDEFRIDVEASSENLLDNLTYASENPEVVTVTEDGMVTAVGYGRGTIRVSTSVEVGENDVKSYSDYIDITVRPAEGIALSANKITLTPNDWRYVSIIRAENVEWSEVTWTSSDENVVTIPWSNSDEAQLLYVGPGTVTVTATDSYGNVASCEVVCVANIEDFKFNTDKIYVAPGETFQLEYTTVPEETGQTIRFESGNVDIATVDPETGLVTGVNYGSTDIFAIASNGGSWSVPVDVCQLPENVALLEEDIKIVFRHEAPLNVVFTPNDADVNKEMTWTVDNPEIVSIESRSEWNDETGQYEITGYIARGNALGTTTITGTTINGLTVTGYVSVEGLDVYYGSKDERNLYITVGETVQLDIDANPEELKNTLELISYDQNVFTVTADGLVTGVAPGENWIDARYILNDEQYYDDIWVVVTPSSGSISLNRNQMVLNPGYYQTLQVRFPNDEVSDITWETSNPDVAGINNYGDQAEIYYVGLGTATITATASNGATATCEVVCVDLRLNETDIVMYNNQTYQLDVLGVPEGMDISANWYTTNSDVVNVENGLITPVGTGTAQIQAYVYTADGIELGWAYANVEVIDFVYVTDIMLTPTQIEIDEHMAGQTVQINATVMPEYATDKTLYWSSSDESVVRVNQNGLVTIVSRGEAVITASATDGSGVKATCQVTKAALEINVKSIELSEEEWEGFVGESTKLVATIKPSYATDRLVTWSSSNESVATVDNDGRVTAIAAGNAVIKVTSHENSDIYAECKVTVKEPVLVESLTITPESWSGEKDEEFTIEATILPDNATYKTLSFESSNPEVATVDNNGQVTLVGEGTCVIKVSTTDGSNLTAECQVTVEAAPVLAESLTITPEKWSGEEGESFRIEATVLPEDTADKTVSFESSDTTVATVDSEGLVTVLKEGTCVITVSTTDGSNLTAECVITGLSGIAWIMSDSEAPIDVYTQQGVLIKHNCSVDDLKLLQSDIYIVRRGNTVKTIYLRN